MQRAAPGKRLSRRYPQASFVKLLVIICLIANLFIMVGAAPTLAQGNPDLTISKTHSGSFVVGSTATWSINLANIGPVNTSNTITVTDDLPGGMTFVSAGSGGVSFNCVGSNGNQTVTCTRVTSLLAGDNVILLINVNVPLSAVGTWFNTADVSMPGEVNTGNNSASDQVTIDPPPPVSPTFSTIGVVPTSIPADGITSATITVTVRDINGNAVADRGITLSTDQPLPANVNLSGTTGTSDASGIVTFTVSGNPSPLPVSVSFRATDNVDSVTITNPPSGGSRTLTFTQPPDPTAISPTLSTASASPTSVLADGVAASTTTVTIRANNNTPLSGASVTISGAPNTGLSILPAPPQTTNGSGQVTFNVRSTAVQTTTFTINASKTGDPAPTQLVAQPQVTFTATNPFPVDAANSTVGVSPGTVLANGIATASVWVHVVRTNGQPAAGAVVTLQANPNSTLTFASAQTLTADSQGNAAFLVTSKIGQTVTFTVQTLFNGNTVVLNAQPQVVFVDDPTGLSQSQSSIMVDPTIVAAGGISASSVTVRVRQGNGLPAVGARVTLVPSPATNVTIASSNSLLTDPNGVASFLVYSTVPQTVNITARIAKAGTTFNLLQTPSIVFTNGTNLTITKTHVGDFPSNSNKSYSIKVQNSGNAAIAGPFTVTDVIPTGLTFVSAVGGGWSCSASGQTVTCTRANGIPAYTTFTITLTVNIPIGAPDGVTNTASITPVSGEFNTADNTSSDLTRIVRPDLTISKSHVSDFAVNTNGVYTIIVRNIGSDQVAGNAYTVRDTLPAGFTYISSAGTNWSCTAAGSPVIVTCLNSAVLPFSSSAPPLTITVKPTAAGSFTNSVQIIHNRDLVTGNNTANDPTLVTATALPDLSITKTHVGNFKVKTNADYTINVKNIGLGSTSGQITVTDTLPAGFTYVSGTGTGWACTQSAGIVTCTNSTVLAVNVSLPPLVIRVKAPAAGNYVNTAVVSMAASESSTANNTANDFTSVIPTPTPLPIAPSDTITTGKPTFQWTKVTGVTSYYLWVNSGNFPMWRQWYQTDLVCGATTCSTQLPFTLYNGNYSWWIQAYHPVTGYSLWSYNVGFTVNEAPPAKPTLINPSGSFTISPTTFSWTQVARAEYYSVAVVPMSPSGTYYQFSLSAAACPPSGGPCVLTLPAGTIRNGSYYWTVAGSGAGGQGQWANSLVFNVNELPPPAVVLRNPSDTITTAIPTYAWNAAARATQYELLVVGEMGTMVDIWYSREFACSAAPCAVSPTVTLENGSYTWWVRASGAGGVGPWSLARGFTVNVAAPLDAILVSPSSTVTNTNSPTFTWRKTANATWYYLYVNGPSGNVIAMWFDASVVCGAGTTCSIVSPVPLPNGPYIWWVQTQGPGGYGPWSDSMMFTVNVPGNSPPAPDAQPQLTPTFQPRK